MFVKPIYNRARELQHRHIDQSLCDMLTILNSNRSLDEILLYLISQSCHMLDTSVGAIYGLDREGNCLRLRASQGLDPKNGTVNLLLERGTPGQAVLTRQTIAIADTGAAMGSAHNPWPLSAAHESLVCWSRYYRALLAVPICIKDELFGAIILYYHEPHHFSPEELHIAAVLSDQAALAIENARLMSVVQDKAILEERQRLARDLHDSVTQALYGISLYAEAAARRLKDNDTAVVAQHLAALQEMTLEALQEMRLLIFELRPPLLAQEGLTAALQTRLEAVEGRNSIETKFMVGRLPELPAATEHSLYRIAQEALNNTLKHAHAKHVTVSLYEEHSTLVLELTDDGIGFDQAAVCSQGGLGLCGIRERVVQLNGRLIIQSTLGVGTRVRVEIAI